MDGLSLDGFEPGCVYEVGWSVGAYLLAERWAEPVENEEPAPAAPFSETDPFAPPPFRDPDAPPNLTREHYPPYLDGTPQAFAHNLERRKKPRTR